MNKPMDEKDKRFRDAQQGQEKKRGGQQGGGGQQRGGAKPRRDEPQQGEGERGAPRDRGAQ